MPYKTMRKWNNFPKAFASKEFYLLLSFVLKKTPKMNMKSYPVTDELWQVRRQGCLKSLP